MKYELEPDNRNCPDEELLNDLVRIAQQLTASTLTKEQYNQHGRFCSATMQNRFGSWNNALAKSGLQVQKRVHIPKEDLLKDLRRVAVDLAMPTVTAEQYRQHGHFSSSTIARHFGTWADALTEAQLSSTGWKPPATEEELFDNMASVWELVGRQPKQKDFRPPVSRYSHETYINRYGSWRAALIAFVQSADRAASDGDATMMPDLPVGTPRPNVQPHRTNRNPGWRLRFLVMRRDHFACRLCGQSPAKDPSVTLHVDHIKPWSEGNETVISNLQTCCEVCNVGKSDLPL